MPEIPTFVSTQGYGSGVAPGGQISPATAGASYGAMAEGFERVAAQFAHVAEQSNELARSAEASRISTDSATQIAELALKYSQDPDPATAPARFRAETTSIRAAILKTTTDPRVQNIVSRSFDQHALSSYVDLSQNAIKKVNANAISGLSQDVTRQSLALSTANNQMGEDAIITNIGQNIAAQRAAGLINDATAANIFSQSMKQAVYLRSNRPGQAMAAQAMFDRVKDRMTSDDIIAVSDHLRSRVENEDISGKIEASVGIAAPSVPGDPSAPRGVRNNNPLNLSYLPGQGATGSDGRFGIYATQEDGLSAAYRQLLINQERGLDTIGKQVGRWAPPNENDTGAYAARVAKELGLPVDAKIDLRDPDLASRMIGAMAKVENGRALDPAVIARAISGASREANVEPSMPIEPTFNGPAARGVLPNVTGVPNLQSMIARAEEVTKNDDPITRRKVIAGVIQQYNQAQTVATADISHQLELKAKIDAAVKHDMEMAQDQVFSSFVAKIAAGEDVPAQALALALSTQSISRPHYEFLDKIATQRREGTDEPRTVLELNTSMVGQDQQPRILQAAADGRLSNKTAVELVRRNQEMRQKPFTNADQEQGYRQVTSLLGGDNPLIKLETNEARRLVRAQNEYVDRIRAGDLPRDVVNDIAVRYPQEKMNTQALPTPRYGPRPEKLEDLGQYAINLTARRNAGTISQADYDREARLLGEYADILKTLPATQPARPQNQGGTRSHILGRGRQ